MCLRNEFHFYLCFMIEDNYGQFRLNKLLCNLFKKRKLSEVMLYMYMYTYLQNISRNEIHSHYSIFYNFIQKMRCIILKLTLYKIKCNISSVLINLYIRHVVTQASYVIISYNRYICQRKCFEIDFKSIIVQNIIIKGPTTSLLKCTYQFESMLARRCRVSIFWDHLPCGTTRNTAQ